MAQQGGRARSWQCCGARMLCVELPHAQAGLMAAPPVNEAWPWTPPRFASLSCWEARAGSADAAGEAGLPFGDSVLHPV